MSDDDGALGELLTGGQPSDDGAEDGREVTHTVEVDLDDGQVGVFDLNRHRNGDETVVLLSAFGGGYQVIALDIDAGGQVLESEVIGEAEDDGRAASMAAYWVEQNPEGLLGSDDDGGLLGGLLGGGE